MKSNTTPIESNDAGRLSDAARSRIRALLVAHMDAHPVVRRPVLSPYQQFVRSLSPLITSPLRVPATLLALIFMVAAAGTTANAAEGALPGNALYAFKVHVLEPVQGLGMVSTEDRARFQVALAERRLNEAEQLAVTSTLTRQYQRELQNSFVDSVTAAKADIETVAKNSPAVASDVSTALDLSLAAHASILDALSEGPETTSAPAVRILAARVRDETRAMSDVAPAYGANGMVAKTNLSASSTPPVAERTSSQNLEASQRTYFAAKDAATAVRTLFDGASDQLDSGTFTQITSAIDATNEALLTSRAALTAHSYSDADAAALKARTFAEESRLILQLGGRSASFNASASHGQRWGEKVPTTDSQVIEPNTSEEDGSVVATSTVPSTASASSTAEVNAASYTSDRGTSISSRSSSDSHSTESVRSILKNLDSNLQM